MPGVDVGYATLIDGQSVRTGVTAIHPRGAADGWLLPVVAETWDGYLNDINSPHVTGQTAADALESAASGPVEEGSVGGGTGMSRYGFKGGSGTASRLAGHAAASYAVGVFVQANFGAAPPARAGVCPVRVPAAHARRARPRP